MSAGSNMSVCGSDPVVTGKKISKHCSDFTHKHQEQCDTKDDTVQFKTLSSSNFDQSTRLKVTLYLVSSHRSRYHLSQNNFYF